MKAPILLILFNRPDLTARLLQIVRSQPGRRIYIAADGPREGNAGDASLCEEVQQLAGGFAYSHEGECHLQLQERNLGCGPGVKAALDWFFSHEEMGIILEDDCHPVASFFEFCDSMLVEHAANRQVWSIAGTSLLPKEVSHGRTHFFSKYSGIWGWATWRRSWDTYEYDLNVMTRSEWVDIIQKQSFHAVEYRYWMHILDLMLAGSINTWDFQVQFISWRENALHLTSSKNLVENAGFRPDATHTTSHSPLADRHAEESSGPYDCIPPKQNAPLDHIIFGEKLNASLELAEWLFSDTQEKELRRQLGEIQEEIAQLREIIQQQQADQAALRAQVATLEQERLRLGRELESFYGLTGAWRCLKKSVSG